jgi:acetyl esterase/lipase
VTLDPVYVERLASGVSMAEPVAGYAPPECPVRDGVIAGVPVRSYGIDGRTLVWLHGGGFSAGDLDMPEADTVARELVARAGVRVVSVGYRLAAFPAGLDDVVAVVSALDEPVLLGGTSAGGNLALAAASTLRGTGRVDSLVLAYPYLHVVHPAAPSDLLDRMAPLPESARFTPAKMRAMAEFYLGERADDPPPLAYPGTADLAGLPRTLVIGAEYDDLLTSALDAGRRLRAAGVPVEEYLEPGVLHGHLNTPGLSGALRTLAEIAAFVRA